MLVTAAFVAASLATTALAHGGVTSYKIGALTYIGWWPYTDDADQTSIARPYSTDGPILSVTDSRLSCNNGGGHAGPNQLTAYVDAGDDITAIWTKWTHAQGPATVYMASCGDSCTDVDSSTLDWFKISEKGLISGTQLDGLWGTGEVVKTLSYTTKVPKNLKPGQYLIRHELLAIHQSFQPQFYPDCAQLNVTGSGSATPPKSLTVKFPGGYSESDPSIFIDIYSDENAKSTHYKIPGPPVWDGES